MRYTDEATAEQLYSQTEGLHAMLLFTVCLGLVIGIILLFLGIRGRVLWLKVWSVGLIMASVLYMGADLLGHV